MVINYLMAWVVDGLLITQEGNEDESVHLEEVENESLIFDYLNIWEVLDFGEFWKR